MDVAVLSRGLRVNRVVTPSPVAAPAEGEGKGGFTGLTCDVFALNVLNSL